jgi:prevent-host-death family protein
MKSIGIRELRQRASEVLREVQLGASFDVTDRGRPVARLGPVPAEEPLEKLRIGGDVSTPTGALDELPPPPRLAKGARTPSTVLTRLRARER